MAASQTPVPPETRIVTRTAPFLIFLALACAPTSAPPTSQPAPAPAAEADPAWAQAPTAENAALRHREIHWFRTAAEYRALTEQIYRNASRRVETLAADRTPGTWAVILDADETVLDNSEYQRRIAEAGLEFDPETWAEWVDEEAAGIIPGADRFIATVREAGGRVAIVTNRTAEECPATVRTMEALGIRTSVVLCRTETSEKEPRFRMAEEGVRTAGPGVILTGREPLPPMDVVLWVGDNVGDFPGLDQGLRDAGPESFEEFGRRFFVLPNPMYGSWAANEWR